MIDWAKREDRGEILALKRMVLPLASEKRSGYIMDHLYDPNHTLVYRQNNHVLSMIEIHQTNILLNGRYMKAHYYYQCLTDPRYRNQGLMDQLMHYALQYSQSTVLVSLLPASRQQFGSSYGFTTTYFKARYTLDKTMVNPDTTGVSFHFRLEAMKDLYGAFMQRFNGFAVRTVDDFSTLVNLNRNDDGELIFYYDDNRVMKGYAIMHFNGTKAILSEVVYLDSLALTRLIAYALSQRPSVDVIVSPSEDLSVWFPKASVVRYDYMMSRVNDMALMQRILNSNVDSTVSLYALSSKPGTYISIE